MTSKPKSTDKVSKKSRSKANEFHHLSADILSHIGVGIYIVQFGKFVYISPQHQKYSGYTNNEIIGHNTLEYVHPDDREKVREKAIKNLKGEISDSYEYRQIAKNGEARWVLEMVAGIVYNSKRATLGSFMDITGRKQMEDALRQNEERYRTIIEDMEDGYFEVDLAGNFIFVNDAECRNLGYPREELIGMNNRQYADEINAKKLYRLFNEIYKTGIPVKAYDLELIKKDGTLSYDEISASLIRDSQRKPIGFRGIARDVTERKRMEESLRQSEEKYRTILEEIQEGYFENDLAGNLTFFNDSVCRIWGYTREELMGLNYRQYTDKETAKKVYQAFAELYRTGEPIKALEEEIIRKDGTKSYSEVSASLIKNSSGEPIGFRGMARDITERKHAEEKIQYLATHDSLTGLPNRMMFSQLLNHAIQTSRRYKRQFAIFFIDLDRFKIINDTLGHEAGDQLLQEIAVRLKQSLRASDIIARLGGDEFVILIEEVVEISQITIVAHRILSATLKPMVLIGEECRVTASIGISIFPTDAEDEQSLMKNADIAMYFAKDEGKNNYQFYSKDIKSQTTERLSIETNLRLALERNEFSLQYQAKLDFKTGMITGVEALLRWQNPYLGSVSPMYFIPVTEETGLIVPIGKWVLKTACAQNTAWQRQGLPSVCMAVNLSLRQLLDDNLIEDIRSALNESGLAPNLLELEITESMVMHNPSRMIAVLVKIKNLGVRLAIDDFGTGYSSLAQLKHFPIDTLKVDRSFIRNIPKDTEDKAITEAIIAMGKTLSLTVVAEGVETQEQMTFLQEHSCDEMQGYYFSKPIAPEQFADLLRNHIPAK